MGSPQVPVHKAPACHPSWPPYPHRRISPWSGSGCSLMALIILGGANIRIQRFFRIFIRRRRYHGADVQNIIRAGYTFQNCLITLHVSPDYFQIRIGNFFHKLFYSLRKDAPACGPQISVFFASSCFHRFNPYFPGSACYKTVLGAFEITARYSG